MEFVVEKGSRGTSYCGIATEASGSVGKLQHPFGSPEAVIRKVFEHQLPYITDRILQLLDHPGPLTTRLRAAVDEVNPSESVRQHCNVIAKEPNRV